MEPINVESSVEEQTISSLTHAVTVESSADPAVPGIELTVEDSAQNTVETISKLKQMGLDKVLRPATCHTPA